MSKPLYPDDPEARITALLLGELDPAKAAAVRAAMERDPALARLHAQLRTTVSLLRQTVALPTPGLSSSEANPVSPRMSEERRRELIAKLRGPSPSSPVTDVPDQAHPRIPWQLSFALAAILVALLSAMALVFPLRTRESSHWADRSAQAALQESERLNSVRSHPAAAPEVRLRLESQEGTTLADHDHYTNIDRLAVRPDKGQQSPSPLARFGRFGAAESGTGRQGGFGGGGTMTPAPDQAGGTWYYTESPRVEALGTDEALGLADKSLRGLARVPTFGDTPTLGTQLAESAPLDNRALIEELAEPSAVSPAVRGFDTLGRAGDLAFNEPPPVAGPVPAPAATSAFARDEDREEPPLILRMGERYGLAPAQSAPAPTQPLPTEELATRTLDRGEPLALEAAGDSLVPLDIKLPIPAFMGTPTDIPLKPPTPAPKPRAIEMEGRSAGVSVVTSLAAQDIERVPARVFPEIEAGRKLAETVPSQGNGLRQITGEVLMETDNGLITPRPAVPVEAQPEVLTAEDPVSTFSLNVTDVSFKLAAASLERGQPPAANTIRSEEFINAFDYQDPEPTADRRVGLAWERARYPFGHQRDLLRLSVKTAARGREAARPLNLVLCLDSSGSMERADRVQTLSQALTVLAEQLGSADLVSVVTFARTARLWVDALPGGRAAELMQRVGELTPEGGTNLEEALRLAYATAARHHRPEGVSRVVLLTDGAANLGDVEPESLRNLVVAQRRQGIALDCFGVGWEGYHDDLLEMLSRNGDGRYGFLNTPEEAVTGFADQLAGALQVAASDVKVQVEFNPQRVRQHRLIGYTRHQLTREQFRDNTVDAAELGAAESGNALYVLETDPAGAGPLAVVRVRFKLPGTDRYEEREWTLPYAGPALPLGQASSALRLAATAGAFAEWLASSPHASEVTPTALLHLLRGVPEIYALDPRPRQLEWMIRQAGSMSGR